MREFSFEEVLEVVVQEYRLDGYEVIEQEGVYYARLELFEAEHVTTVTEQNLTRMADAIVRGLS